MQHCFNYDGSYFCVPKRFDDVIYSQKLEVESEDNGSTPSPDKEVDEDVKCDTVQPEESLEAVTSDPLTLQPNISHLLNKLFER